MKVEARTQNHITSVFQSLVADGLSHLFYEVGIPCGSETSADGESRSEIVFTIALTVCIDMYAGRTVALYCRWNAQSWYGYGVTSRSRYEFLLVSQHGTTTHEAVVAAAYQQLCLFFQRHGFNDFVDVVSS